jgi:hypothetical protein
MSELADVFEMSFAFELELGISRKALGSMGTAQE